MQSPILRRSSAWTEPPGTTSLTCKSIFPAEKNKLHVYTVEPWFSSEISVFVSVGFGFRSSVVEVSLYIYTLRANSKQHLSPWNSMEEVLIFNPRSSLDF